MFKLEKALKEWISQGFLTADQAKRIQTYETSKSGSWILSGLLTLGVVAVAIGIISLIAANWQHIPDSIKVALDFLLLILLAASIFQVWKKQKDSWFEVLLIAFLLLCLASIGLIAQVYQTGGELHQALLLWSVITVGIVFVSKKFFTPFIWMGGFLAALDFTFENSPLFWPIFQGNLDAITLFLPLLCAVFILFGQKFFAERNNLLSAVKVWMIVTGLFALVAADGGAARIHSVKDLIPYAPAGILAICTWIGLAVSQHYHRVQKILLSMVVFLLLGLFALPMIEAKDFAYAVVVILILGLMAIFFASRGQRRMFHLFLVLVGLRLIELYFQALGGLALTGIGLVAAGLLIILMGVLWNKYRVTLLQKIERWTQ